MVINGELSCWIEKDDSQWFFQAAESGQEAPEVTGGAIELPQGGSRQSRAAVTGGVFQEGAEIPIGIMENMQAKLQTIAPEELKSAFMSGDVHAAETLLTGLIQTEIADVGQGFADNADEAEAVQNAIASVHVKTSSTITYDELIESAREEVMNQLKGVFA